ncbi:hypothetical protein FH972_009253 [Carpinus fangiana]|uniref:Sieve element occlusion C-terminal domain-containing protein n=1 Tax=Carpinus fangiana TaxID=176857 RepID=A0A5N6R496_9ROSI|nr:hypothetical protein FH972_009253 [Carpinus fangiana]
MLEQMFIEARSQPERPHSQYEVVWLPVLDRSTTWNETKRKQFEALQQQMPWYSVYEPFQLGPAVIRYIKEVWHFNKKALIVVLDPQGRVVNPNAIHMMWIWGSLAFPFSSTREESLWKEESWRLELLADAIDPLLYTWVSEGKYICLYGGDDMEWVRKFTLALRGVAQAAKIQLEMLYVGKSNPRVKVRKNNTTIVVEKLSHVLQDTTLIWFFWARLESMWYSKEKHGKSVENDTIMQEIMAMLSFDRSDQGWAVISKGSAELVRAKGDTILPALIGFDSWKEKVGEIGFVPALNQHLSANRTPHHCTPLIQSWTPGIIPKRMICAECGLPMEKILVYSCCTD